MRKLSPDYRKRKLCPEELSKQYRVRRLTEADVDRIYALSAGNPMFYQYCPPDATRESILHDMKALPPRTTCDDKYYIGYFEEDRLVAVMDLILGYPNEETAFIGLFMMEKKCQGKGIGSAIVEECFGLLDSVGYRFVRLGFAKGNPQSEAFWVKNGFARTGVEADNGNYTVVVMERSMHTLPLEGMPDVVLRNKKEESGMERCEWCLCNEKMIKYHDEEWGVPVHDDRKQFEFLMLEVMQCGLNWNMMLQKREVFRKCFDGFDYEKVAEYGEEDIQRILETEGMIKSRRKIEAVIHNARCFQKVQEEFGTFSEYLWAFSKGKMILYMGHQKGQIPARNGLSDAVSKDLRKRGFKYLGSVTVYAHLQACGIVNDHVEGCWRYREVMEGVEVVGKRKDGEFP